MTIIIIVGGVLFRSFGVSLCLALQVLEGCKGVLQVQGC